MDVPATFCVPHKLRVSPRVRMRQAVCIQGKATPKEMIRYIESVPKESVVDVEAEVVAAPAPITATSQQV
jgi:hypothetical protein